MNAPRCSCGGIESACIAQNEGMATCRRCRKALDRMDRLRVPMDEGAVRPLPPAWLTPLAIRQGLYVSFRERAAAYYERELKELRAGGSPAFSGHAVSLGDDGELSFEFYAVHDDGESLGTLCGAMTGIADFVQPMVAEAPDGIFSAYSAGIYLAGDDKTAGDRDMLAGLAAGGGVFCKADG